MSVHAINNNLNRVSIKIYKGDSGGRVTVDGDPLDKCLDIVNHSPDGFSWGYSGSGPAQLSLAIMVSEYGKDIDKHPVSYRELKEFLVSKMPSDEGFTFNSTQVWAKVSEITSFRS